ncbi:putative HTH-type transcriptional regulator YbfP [Heyndrickxia sporothermodurans]|nr:putative HTH-type transcriptional regulator YbfP [Heyndrickxia sporothermodurans]
MSYQPIIQKAISHIEENLHQPLSVDSVASYSGFSKFHFLRVFQNEVGMTIGDYIRIRRLTSAASMLVETNESIIQIAYHYCFGAPESFTRAFKKVYQMPPGEYRRVMSSILKKNGGDKMEQQQVIKGWFLTGSHPYNYEMGIDTKNVHQGKCSGYLRSVTVSTQEEFATMMQQFKAKNFIGKRLKMSAFIKTEKIDGFCGLWMRVDNASGDVLQFDNMSDRPIVKDTNWNLYTVVLDIPENSSTISFGVLLSGKGHAWADHFKFEEVDERTPTTNIEVTYDIQDEPMNLSFEM